LQGNSNFNLLKRNYPQIHTEGLHKILLRVADTPSNFIPVN